MSASTAPSRTTALPAERGTFSKGAPASPSPTVCKTSSRRAVYARNTAIRSVGAAIEPGLIASSVPDSMPEMKKESA